ncbi:MAG: SDR family oxidoreductase [Chloroflexi bacterium]|nr:SDR family oxidoreductase [Chloroflexota bacterium]
MFDFWDLNVTGTFYVLETAVRPHSHFLHISSTGMDEWPGIYSSNKLLAEELVRTYAARHGLNALILRPAPSSPTGTKPPTPTTSSGRGGSGKEPCTSTTWPRPP